ncbi:ABC transporter ATP-binding protein [Gilvimarinus sp. F26214L]|uniref:ABC transporter ATP-binding protein n=1 Tax=Gilvimarinus sp. DZF01 TaxID=3461371 RepID=UPI004045DF47
MSLLEVNNLSVDFTTLDGVVSAVNDLSFSIEPGEALGIVGESGSGKSQTILSIMGLLASNGRARGEILFKGQDLLTLSNKALNDIRGKQIAMIFQDPMTSLNPYLRISTQMTEVLRLHEGVSQAEARKRALEMLDLVKIPDARNRFDRYPHEFSGGMRQRVVIAMALLCRPELIIADEPTTALDVTVQAQILRLLEEVRQEFNSAIIMITHDLGVVASICDQVLVMYSGETMEQGSLDDIFNRSQNPYTRGLLRSVPLPDQPRGEPLYSIPGNPPNALRERRGCPFYARCDYRADICNSAKPALVEVGKGHWKACHHDDLDDDKVAKVAEAGGRS